MPGKDWYYKTQEIGVPNAGEAGRASYSENFEPLIFYISEIGVEQSCGNERKEVRAWGGRETQSGIRVSNDTLTVAGK